MELRRERLEAEILDPRRNFERVRAPVEVRWDPLTGLSSRLLPQGALQPPARLDLAQLAEASRPSCPFCAERIEAQTPRFPPELWPEGRIRRGEAVLFPNLLAYAEWSSVSVYSPHLHLLPLEHIDAQLLRDNLATQLAFSRAVLAHDPASGWVSVNANQLPPSGSSIFHPHLQGAAAPMPSTMQRLLADVPPARFREYVESEREGERRVASTDRVDWVASFAPLGPAELRAFMFEAASPAEVDDALCAELADGISRALRFYAELGFQSFNLALYGAPPGTAGYPLNLRLLARAYYGPLHRSDAMWSERLHWEAAVDVAPETVAELARPCFQAPAAIQREAR